MDKEFDLLFSIQVFQSKLNPFLLDNAPTIKALNVTDKWKRPKRYKILVCFSANAYMCIMGR